MAISIIPKGAAARGDWFLNWKLEFPLLAPGLGFSAGEITTITNEAAWAVFACQMATDAQSYGSAWVGWRDLLLEDDSTDPVGVQPMTTAPTPPVGAAPARGIIHRNLGYIRRVKAAPGYTSAIGDQLRVNAGSPPPPNPATARPELGTAALAMFQVRLDWPRYDFGGIELQTQRAAETDWTSLGVKTAVEFTDARPPLVAGQPEVRRYRAIFVLNDAPVGLWSNVVSVTVHP